MSGERGEGGGGRREERCSGSDNERDERQGRSGGGRGRKVEVVPKFGNNKGELIVLSKL